MDLIVPITQTAAQTRTKIPQWVWPKRIPRNEITMLAGNPGTGKSHLALWLAAQITRGKRWPDCKESARKGSVCVLTAEDSLEYTMNVRLKAADADLEKVTYLVGAKSEEKLMSMYSLPSFAGLIRDAVSPIEDLEMIIIDPLTAYMGGKDENKNVDVRSFLAPLAGLAGLRGVSVLAISHLNKDMSKMAIFRLLGSVGFTGAARAVWLVVKDPDDEQRRLFLPSKSNLAKEQEGLAFSLQEVAVQTDEGPAEGSVCMFEMGVVRQTADEIFADTLTPMQTKTQMAKKWLKEELGEKPQPQVTLVENAKKKRVSEKTLNRAKQEMEVESYAMKVGEKVLWMWRLPKEKK